MNDTIREASENVHLGEKQAIEEEHRRLIRKAIRGHKREIEEALQKMVEAGIDPLHLALRHQHEGTRFSTEIVWRQQDQPARQSDE